MFRFSLLITIFLLASNIYAQQDAKVASGNSVTRIIQLAPPPAPQQITFDVNADTIQMIIDIRTNDTPDSVTIIDPSGAIIPSSEHESFSIEAIKETLFSAALFLTGFTEGEHIKVSRENPAAGKWQVNLSLPASSNTGSTISITQTGTLRLISTTSKLTYNEVEPVIINVNATRSGKAVTGAETLAKIYQQESKDSSQTITLYDDGNAPDIKAKDGLYTGKISHLPPGYYMADTIYQDNISTRKSRVNFEVFPVFALLTNNISDAGIDTNADGLFERIEVNFEIDVKIPGSYSLTTELKQGEQSLLKGTQRELSPGLNTLPVVFSTKDIKKYLKSDGPYKINDVRLKREHFRLIDKRTDFGSTQAYTLQQLQRPLTIIVNGITESAIDTNGNGKFDALNVGFQVDILHTNYRVKSYISHSVF